MYLLAYSVWLWLAFKISGIVPKDASWTVFFIVAMNIPWTNPLVWNPLLNVAWDAVATILLGSYESL